MFDADIIQQDKNLHAVEALPLVTVYDDNLFVRNDYDVLSLGQRNYLIAFFQKLGFKQKTGRLLTDGERKLHLPRPNSNLAVSGFSEDFLQYDRVNFYCVTPTQFAEALFHFYSDPSEALPHLKALIENCPYNIEWLRDTSYRSEIEGATSETFVDLMAYQKQIVADKFKMKKTL